MLSYPTLEFSSLTPWSHPPIKSGSQAHIGKMIIHELPPSHVYLLSSIGKGLAFGESFYPYPNDVRDIFPCIMVIRGALCDKERTIQLGGALLQDQHLFLVVTHSSSINVKRYFFCYIWCYDLLYLNTMLIYWIKWLDDAT